MADKAAIFKLSLSVLLKKSKQAATDNDIIKKAKEFIVFYKRDRKIDKIFNNKFNSTNTNNGGAA